MAKPIELTSGKKGTKNSNARSAAAQRPHNSKPVATRTAAVRPYKKDAHNPASGHSDIHAVTRPAMGHAVGRKLGHAAEWMQKHGLTMAATFHPFDKTMKPADKVGATATKKSTKKTSAAPQGARVKVQSTSRAFKTTKKARVAKSA